MKRSTDMWVSYTHIEQPEVDPFHFMGVRELSRATGIDASNLSRYRNGKAVCPKKVYDALVAAVEAKFEIDEAPASTKS